MDVEFFLVDVFTQQPFGGNQLAVLPDARGLSGAAMRALAREFNFSETAFVLPPAPGHGHPRLRIFTPRGELPFAGHPTIGAASVLAARQHGGAGAAEDRLTFEERVGPVTVDVRGAFSRLAVDLPFESPAHRPSVMAVAGALTLPEEDILDCWYGGVGLNFCYVRLASAEPVDRAVLDRAAWAAGIAPGWAPHLYVFAGDFRSGGSHPGSPHPHGTAMTHTTNNQGGEEPAARKRNYPSDTTDAEWAVLEPLLPVAACELPQGGRPEKHPRRNVVDAIRYVNDNGVKWRAVPVDFGIPWRTVDRFFQRWRASGALARIHPELHEQVRLHDGLNPRTVAVILDSQSVKGAETVGADTRGFDGGKLINGRKRHLIVDMRGMPLSVMVTPASPHDSIPARDQLFRLSLTHPEVTVAWADSAYGGTLTTWAHSALGLTLKTVPRRKTRTASPCWRNGGE